MAGIEAWVIGWAIAGGVVLVAALLLLAIIVTARGIEKEAGRALEALRRIDTNTAAIWALGSTAKRLNAIRDYVEGLEDLTARTAAERTRREGGA